MMKTSMDQNDEISSRPSLAFPVGLALLLLLLLGMCAFFLCCLHWDKLRSLICNNSSDQAEPDLEYQKPPRPNTMGKHNQQESVPVLMPGDQVPKFIAVACPCELPATEKLTVVVQKPSKFRDAAATIHG